MSSGTLVGFAGFLVISLLGFVILDVFEAVPSAGCRFLCIVMVNALKVEVLMCAICIARLLQEWRVKHFDCLLDMTVIRWMKFIKALGSD